MSPSFGPGRKQSNDILPIRKAHKLYFFQKSSFVDAAIPRLFEKDRIMDRDTSELIELGSVSDDTAGDVGLGGEISGKFKPLGLSVD